MKITIPLLTVAISAAGAQPHSPHRHAHLHHERRNPDATHMNAVSGPTIVAYELNGESISKAEVMQGIANGTLVWANGEPVVVEAPPKYAPETSSIAPAYSAPPSSSEPQESSAPAPPQYSSPAESSSAPSPPSGGSGGGYGGGEGVDTPFPDGELDCSHFPSDYGAISLNYLGLGGWSGIQHPESASAGFANIMTVTTGTCNDGNCCTEGAYCSYACPPGYQKSQWPETQGATGQSVGGIKCEGGKLKMTNSAMSKSLCMPGASQVEVLVKNDMSDHVAVCRTDYPGTEAETIPVSSGPGSTEKLTCPDGDNYYNWEGSHTSAQYYVNPAGVGIEDGCQWGSDSNPWGNYAPLNLGVGYSNGAAWLSIFQNLPTTSATLDFSVEIVGDGISGTCKYSNGQYCGGAHYDDCSSTTGCTVSLTNLISRN